MNPISLGDQVPGSILYHNQYQSGLSDWILVKQAICLSKINRFSIYGEVLTK